jgi:fatty-acyl-CoA synthase
VSYARCTWARGHARFRPHAPAIIDLDHGRTWTWAEVQASAETWAAALSRGGVAAGDRVAVLSQNRAEVFVLLFACAEIGAILFPINWRLSDREIAWQLDDASPAAVLTEPDLAGRITRPTTDLTRPPAAAPFMPTAGSDDDAAVLMYTSGTSGTPKGALLTWRQLKANAANTVLACDLTPADRTLTFTPLFHTGGLNCLSTPLLQRGGAVVLSRGFDPAAALAAIAAHRVTLLMGVPTIYQMMADQLDFGSTDLTSVRDALCGGAPLSATLLERYLDRGVPLRQGFGMTEAGPNLFSTPPGRVREKLGTVGLPIHDVEVRLVDAAGGDVPVGAPGELWVRGAVVFAGYWNRPDATAASFHDGWFRTGDVLSRDEDGFYLVSGRLKEMYISGGENVYPAEVEAIVLQAPGVGQVAVVGVPDPKWGEVGVLFVEPAHGASIDPAATRAWLGERIARYKLPKHVVVREALPRTASGKIDKASLVAEARSAS